MALKRVWLPSPNYSSRGGSAVRLIVLHTAEGARTYQDLGAFFSSSSSGVSSHVGIDDTLGTIGEYVKRDKKSWTQGNANPYSVSVEQCAFANWTRSEWLNEHANMLANTAAWIAEEATFYGIPIVALTSTQAQDGHSKGVCQHINLGSAGGGHVDCDYGSGNYPINEVIEMAKGGSTSTPTPTSTLEDDMIIENKGTTYQLVYDGPKSYWRTLPDGAAKQIPDNSVIKDDGSLLSLWKVGAN